MIVRVSMIPEFFFCPLKLYLVGDKQRINDNIKKSKVWRRVYNSFRRGIKDASPRIKRGMKLDEIESILKNEINVRNHEGADEILNILKMEVKMNSLKIKRFMDVTGEEGENIIEYIVPSSLDEYRIYDDSLQLSGKIHRIEIMNGDYYPVKIKIGIPPLKGVWDSDALEIAAYGLLIENEFDKEVPIGFVDYIKVGERRVVAIDYELREAFFNIIDEIKRIIEKKELPVISPNMRKCEKCDIRDVCPEY